MKNNDERLKDAFDFFEKAVDEHLTSSPPEFNRTGDMYFLEMSNSKHDKLKDLIRHFHKIYNKRYIWDCREQYYEVGDTVYYLYDDQIITGRVSKIEYFKTESFPDAYVFYWVEPDNIKWYEKVIDKVRYFYYSIFRRNKEHFSNRKYIGHAVGRNDIYPTHKEALYNLIMNNLCDYMDKLQFIFIDNEYDDYVNKP
jgi:hypothetical protein